MKYQSTSKSTQKVFIFPPICFNAQCMHNPTIQLSCATFVIMVALLTTCTK